MPSEASAAKPKEKISMRHSKLTASEAALLSGELNKPSWESKNEGIHERVSFEDSIWGFDLAGGSFYNTPLRVTYVKPDSRADKAGIRAGDRLKRINDIDTSTLTIQEAHEIIIESGVYLRLAVTAPEDIEDAYFCYEDPLANDGYDSEEERRKEAERERKRHVHAKVSSYWSLQWPWVSKRRVIYRESNCFMVPSKFEDVHKDKFLQPPNHGHIVQEDISLDSTLQNASGTNGVVDPKIANDKNVNPDIKETDKIPPVDLSKPIPNDEETHLKLQESSNKLLPMETNDIVENKLNNLESENFSMNKGKNEIENTNEINENNESTNEETTLDDEDVSENIDSIESKFDSELSENIDTLESKDETEDTENVNTVDSKHENESSENFDSVESTIDSEISEHFEKNEDSNVNGEGDENISNPAAETDEFKNDDVSNEMLEENTETAKGDDETNCEKVFGEEANDSEREQ